MRIKVAMPTEDSKRLREKIIEGAEKIEDDETGQEEWAVVRDQSYFSVMLFSNHIIGHVNRSWAVPDYQRDIAEGMQRARTNGDDVFCGDSRYLDLIVVYIHNKYL
jgi:hypothetical protein